MYNNNSVWLRTQLIMWIPSCFLFQVAIKIIDVEQGKKDYVMKNLTREAKVLSMLQHPSIVRLYETIWVSGETL